jgi:hypothetical protein
MPLVAIHSPTDEARCMDIPHSAKYQLLLGSKTFVVAFKKDTLLHQPKCKGTLAIVPILRLPSFQLQEESQSMDHGGIFFRLLFQHVSL